MFIRRTERIYLILFGAFISLMNAINLLIVILEKVHNPSSSLWIYEMARASQFPTGRFLSLFIVAFVVFGKRYIAALSWTLLCLVPFIYEFSMAYRFIYTNVDYINQTPALAVFKMIANPLDYLATLLTIVMAVWLISAVVRSFTLTANESAQ